VPIQLIISSCFGQLSFSFDHVGNRQRNVGRPCPRNINTLAQKHPNFRITLIENGLTIRNFSPILGMTLGGDSDKGHSFPGLPLTPPPAHRPPSPKVRFRRLRLARTTLETRPLALCLRRHLLPPLQTKQPDRRYLPRSNPRP
jgi:hypothetical protein